MNDMRKKIVSLLAIIMIIGLVTSYLFMGSPVRQAQPAPTNVDTGFVGPTGEPYVKGPTAPPSVVGPKALPPLK